MSVQTPPESEEPYCLGMDYRLVAHDPTLITLGPLGVN